MTDIYEQHTGWVSGNHPYIIPQDNIKEVTQCSWKGSGEHDKAMIVKVELAEPSIAFICKDQAEWDQLYTDLSKCKKVVSITKYKKD